MFPLTILYLCITCALAAASDTPLLPSQSPATPTVPESCDSWPPPSTAVTDLVGATSLCYCCTEWENWWGEAARCATAALPREENFGEWSTSSLCYCFSEEGKGRGAKAPCATATPQFLQINSTSQPDFKYSSENAMSD